MEFIQLASFSGVALLLQMDIPGVCQPVKQGPIQEAMKQSITEVVDLGVLPGLAANVC